MKVPRNTAFSASHWMGNDVVSCAWSPKKLEIVSEIRVIQSELASNESFKRHVHSLIGEEGSENVKYIGEWSDQIIESISHSGDQSRQLWSLNR